MSVGKLALCSALLASTGLIAPNVMASEGWVGFAHGGMPNTWADCFEDLGEDDSVAATNMYSVGPNTSYLALYCEKLVGLWGTKTGYYAAGSQATQVISEAPDRYIVGCGDSAVIRAVRCEGPECDRVQFQCANMRVSQNGNDYRAYVQNCHWGNNNDRLDTNNSNGADRAWSWSDKMSHNQYINGVMCEGPNCANMRLWFCDLY